MSKRSAATKQKHRRQPQQRKQAPEICPEPLRRGTGIPAEMLGASLLVTRRRREMMLSRARLGELTGLGRRSIQCVEEWRQRLTPAQAGRLAVVLGLKEVNLRGLRTAAGIHEATCDRSTT